MKSGMRAYSFLAAGAVVGAMFAALQPGWKAVVFYWTGLCLGVLLDRMRG